MKLASTQFSTIISIVVFVFLKEGLGIVESVDPPSGTLIADFEATENVTTLICNVTNSAGSRTTTTWFVQNFRGIDGLQTIHVGFFPELFTVGGDIDVRSTDPSRTYRNHLTIANLTSKLDNVVLFCGTAINRQANFTLRVYRPPSLADNVQLAVLEGTQLTVNTLELEPKAFPFPVFHWQRNDQLANNISGAVYYGYPNVNFSNVSRGDTGSYSIFAENTIIGSTQIVGNDTGSFFLNVLYGPEIAEPVSDTFATLEDSNVTLICGTDLRGNPKPTVEWFTNTGETVNDQCFSTSNDSDTVSLTIYGATLNDSGIWSCVVSSNLTTGQLQRNLTLTILAPPSEPLNFTVTSFGATWIASSWMEPSFIGVPDLMLFVVSAEPTNATNANSLAKATPPKVNAVVDKGTMSVNITNLFPGEEYELSAVAVIENSDVQAVSNSSASVFTVTLTTVPDVLCLQTPTSANGNILVSWDYSHTGGLNLTGVSIEYRGGNVETFQSLPDRSAGLGLYPNEDLLRTKNVRVTNFTAGFEYVFRVTASNENGYGSVECQPVQHLIGIPQQPVIQSIASTAAGDALLDVFTNGGGVQKEEILTFIVESELIDSRREMTTSLHAVSNYIDSTVTTLIVSGLTPGQAYQFTVKARNRFGSSNYSDAEVHQIFSSGSAVSAQLVGGAVGGVVIVILVILVIVVLIVLLLLNRKNRVRKSTKDLGSKEMLEDGEMIDNDLYDSKEGKSKLQQDEKQLDEDEHYSAIPTLVATQEKNEDNVVYDSVRPPSTNHSMKQSDNPLYTSAQDLRRSIATSSRANSLENVNAISARSSPVPLHYDVPQFAGRSQERLLSGSTDSNNIISNRLSYGLELEFSNRQIPPVRHTRSLSQGGSDPLYTEL